jgi:UDP-N-acetyl-D-galactosamine dehydrogenase
MNLNKNTRICIIGLGYVGLPLALAFEKYFNVIGFDINNSRIKELKKKNDVTREVSKNDLLKAKSIFFTSNEKDIKKIDIFIVTVPTPIYKNKSPDLSILKNACYLVGKKIIKNNIVIFESTVFPGATEEICMPIVERVSKLKFNVDFFCGYSPERINPGQTRYKLENIVKITSGSNNKTLNLVDNLYKKIIKVGTYKAQSIKIAEAAKVIENTQRDLNIALVNELSILFDKLNIDTNKVLQAASTKWNFANFKPGLVGGHCIGVDPYYLTYKSKKEGYNPKVILAGRKVNDEMSLYVANKAIKFLKKIKKTKNKKVLIMGFAFKENCRDVRNTKVYDLYIHLVKKGLEVDIYDPVVDPKEVKKYYQINLSKKIFKKKYSLIIIAVGHNIFKKINNNFFSEALLFDLKSIKKEIVPDYCF